MTDPRPSPASVAGAEEGTVAAVSRCVLRAGDTAWDFPARNAEAILAHWERRKAENPVLFDGVIHLMTAWSLAGGVFTASFQATDFKSYLYWRDMGFPASEGAVSAPRDCFGAALIRSSEGDVIFGRQRAGNINAGLLYPPGGFIDPRDVSASGALNIDASIWREIAEETGLGGAELRHVPGYKIAFASPLVSIAAEYRSHLAAGALRQRILDHLAADPDPELTDIVLVRSPEDLGDDTPAYAKLLLRDIASSGA